MLPNNNNINKSGRVLIIGTLPPPIGGVSVHTKRLLLFLKKKDFKYSFHDYKKSSFVAGIKLFLKAKIIHLHANNQVFLFLMSLFSFFGFKKLIITVHGKYNCRRWHLNILETISMIVSSTPILLNENDYHKVRPLNRNSLMITSFIPPMDEDDLEDEVLNQIKGLRNSTKRIFCSNAYRLVYDFKGDEVYGIIELIKFFNQNLDLGFVLSDPSGEYNSFIKSNNIRLNRNIVIINNSHSFFNVILLSDIVVRNTTTDGDSLSIREALFLNKVTFATGCVQRPNGVHILKDLSQLIEDCKTDFVEKDDVKSNGAEDLLALYSAMCKK